MLAGLACADSALADPVSIEGSANGTVQAAGPRSGSNGSAFLNIEGSGNSASFQSYGTVDFDGAGFGLAFGGPIGDITSLSLALVESNAAFTLPGTLEFYLASDAATPVVPGSGTPNYVSGQDSAASVGSALGTLTFLGTGVFNTTGNTNTGQTDTFDLTSTLTTEAKQAIIGAINGGATFRFVITSSASTPGVAATFAGVTHSSLAGPTLSIDAVSVPEPGSSALLALGGAAAMLGRRRR